MSSFESVCTRFCDISIYAFNCYIYSDRSCSCPIHENSSDFIYISLNLFWLNWQYTYICMENCVWIKKKYEGMMCTAFWGDYMQKKKFNSCLNGAGGGFYCYRFSFVVHVVTFTFSQIPLFIFTVHHINRNISRNSMDFLAR